MIAFNAVHAEITWTLSNGILTISGTDMPDYDNVSPQAPWYGVRDKIKIVVIKHGVTNIGRCAFMGCENLPSINIPNSVTNIGRAAFAACASLASVNIPNSVTSIGEIAFSSCTSLPVIKIPNSVTSIGDGAFINCSALTSISIPNTVTSIGLDAFSGCSSLTSISLPNSVTSIESDMFYECKKLTSITIPNSVTSIKRTAFYYCSSLTSISIPKSVTTIEEYAFWNSTSLSNITCNALTPPSVGDNVFYKTQFANGTLYVPASSIQAYREAKGWKDWKNIQAIADSYASFILTDGDTYTNELQLYEDEISYTRTFNNTKWQALYIPFSLSYEDWKDDFEVAYINGIRQYDKNDDGAIDETIMDVIKIKEGSLIPNNPYLIKAKSVGEKTFSLTDATLYPAEENSIDCKTTIAEYTFTGTYSTIPSATLIANQYYAMGGGELIISDGSNDLNPYRWYMKINGRSPMYNTSNAAKSITINVVGEDSETTGICQLKMDNDKSPVYDLNGRRVSENSLKPGMYIKNGKKVILK